MSISSSIAGDAIQSLFSTNSLYTISSSWASSSIISNTSLYASQSQWSVSSSFSLDSIQSIYSTQSIYSISSSWVSSSVKITNTDTASYISSSAIFDKNVYNYTASWANNALQSLFSTQSISSSYLSGSGQVISPTNLTDIANKAYIDNIAQFGLDFYFRSASADISGYHQMLKLTTPISASATT